MKKIITVSVVVLVFVTIWLILISKNKQITAPILSNTAIPETTISSPDLSPASPISEQENKLIEIIINLQGLSQNNLTIKVGDTIKFLNKDSVLHWPASDPHPNHTLCPGFDSLHGLKQNESFSFVFDKKMVCSFHDHLHSRDNNFSGVITVK